jgi:hypothetical protein
VEGWSITNAREEVGGVGERARARLGGERVELAAVFGR